MTTAAPDLLVSPSSSFPHPQESWGLPRRQRGEVQVHQVPTVHRCFAGVIMLPDSRRSSCEVSNIIPIWWMGTLRIRGSGRNMPTTVVVGPWAITTLGPQGRSGAVTATWEEKAGAEEAA